MLKKSLSIILILCALYNMVYADSGFIDFSDKHWAFNAVSTLISDGTISGYEDGTFKPDGTVSRAEFVKMIGKGTAVRENDFIDVPKSHWAYEFIMSSGLEAKQNNQFEPDTAITREEAAQLLWQRNGSTDDINAPSVITNQAKSKEAAAFVYMYGIMNGNDGINLRLSDTLSRAEAAVLIIKARENNTKINIEDAVSDDVLKVIFESFALFEDNTYNPDRKFTNGEIARAALRLADDEFNLSYKNYPDYKYSFENEYAKDLSIITNQCLGTDKLTQEFANEYANNLNTLASLVYAGIRRSNSSFAFGNVNNYYSDAGDLGGNASNSCITFAYENGIMLYNENQLNPEKQISAKGIALILLQLDDIIGLQTNMSTRRENGKNIIINRKISKQIDEYPAGADYYGCILEGVPDYVYDAPFNMLDNAKSHDPKSVFSFAGQFKELFVKQLDKIVYTAEKSYGITLEFEFIPSLVYDNGQGFTMRVLCKVIKAGDRPDYEKIFGENTLLKISGNIEEGQEFYIEIITKYDLFS